ncbi:IS630 family transposase [Planctomicrobium sp. SH661]|uniref:IS630 family transposase n=1 Tax=Planctomicrobium sp. SH661 TaxID=3448124 RepID=UPI003F5C078F
MDGSIHLTAQERKMLLQAYRFGVDVSVSRRAHLVLLRADGLTWQQIKTVLFCSFDLISTTLKLFSQGRVAAVLEVQTPQHFTPAWMMNVLRWVTQHTPRDFGYFRSRWSCETLAHLLAFETGQRLSGETIRRGLHRLGLVWRRPRPVVGPADPEHAEKFQRIQQLLENLSPQDVAVFQDEVDLNLNPKIGNMWMKKGQQAEVVTPGNNQKCHVAGSLIWRTGTLLVSRPHWRRNTVQFLAHLDDLRSRLRGYRKIHVICDNAKFHDSRAVKAYLQKWNHRIEVHFLPKYAPQTNPIERVWWHLHETITRNHRCQTLEELIDQAYEWFEVNNNHYLDMRHSFAKAA